MNSFSVADGRIVARTGGEVNTDVANHNAAVKQNAIKFEQNALNCCGWFYTIALQKKLFIETKGANGYVCR